VSAPWRSGLKTAESLTDFFVRALDLPVGVLVLDPAAGAKFVERLAHNGSRVSEVDVDQTEVHVVQGIGE
jgi:hypothetical protein